MDKDKIYINSDGQTRVVEVPAFGEVKFVIQDGKVLFIETKKTEKIKKVESNKWNLQIS